MKAIFTKYIPATDTKESRIKAWADGWGSVTIGYPHDLSGSAVYAAAALQLANKFDVRGSLIAGGAPPNGCGVAEVFVFADSDRFEI